MKQISFIVILLFTVFLGFSKPIELNKRDNIDLTPGLSYYIDSANNLSKDQAIQLLETNQFHKSNAENCINFGSLIEPVWVSIEVYSKTNVDKILHLKCPYLYYVDFYLLKNNQWVTYTPTGKKRPLKNRGDFIDRNFAWLLEIEQDKTVKILMRVQTNAPTLVPLSIESEGYYLRTSTLAELIYGIYFGILIIMIFYNMILYYSLREISFFYYSLSIICTLIIFSTSNGFFTKYITPNSWELSYFTAEVFMCLIILPTSLFAINFLDLKRYSKLSYIVLKSLCYASVPLLIICLWTQSSNLASQAVGVLAISLLSSGLIAWYKGNPYAKYYVLAWTFYLIGGVAVVGRNIGVFPSNFFTDNGAEIGSALEVCLLAFALADKFRKLRKEKNAIVKEHLELVEKQKMALETEVKARTIDLDKAVDDLHQTIAQLNSKQLLIEAKNKNITSSINYALYIQQAILPEYEVLRKAFTDLCIFYQPKDIVSGDFLFYYEVDSLQILVVADCTGHGVPGAFMSLIGHNLLHEIIKSDSITEPNLILEELDKRIESRLHSTSHKVNDGMDLSIIQLDSVGQTLKFAGAKNGLLLVDKNKECFYIKGDRRSIGDLYRKTESFKLHTLDLGQLDWCYAYTDGFQDQFGQLNNTKYCSLKLKKFLHSISSSSGTEQMIFLSEEFHNWKGDESQIDDVSVVGFKI